MKIDEFLKMLKRSFKNSFKKKKLLFTFPFLIICGFLIVFFKTISLSSDNWIDLCLIFFPILLSAFRQIQSHSVLWLRYWGLY